MHIALVITSLGVGGAEKILVRLAKHWSDSGHKVSFITFFHETKHSYTLDNNDIQLINLGEDHLSKNQAGIVKYVFKLIKRIGILRQKFKWLKPDIIVSFLTIANISALLANFGLHIPIIVSERTDPIAHNIPKLYKKLRFILYKHASLITVQNQSIAQYFATKLADQVVVIPNFVKPPKTQKKSITSAQAMIKKIISVGRLDGQKDHRTLIYAFAQLADLYPELTVTIYGEGELRGFLQNVILELHLTDRVFLPGVAVDIEDQLLNADLFVLPSIIEGFSNALCEAMSCGLPVIAADCTGNANIIENGVDGLLFPCGNAEELARLIEQLLNNLDYFNKLAHNAKNIVNRFSEKPILKQWDQAIENILLNPQGN